MSDIKLENKGPMKKAPSAKKGTSKYPFEEMKVEQSFLVEEGKRHSVSTLANRYAKQYNETLKKGEDPKLFSVYRDEEGDLRCIRKS